MFIFLRHQNKQKVGIKSFFSNRMSLLLAQNCIKHHGMMKREHPAIDLTADEDDGEPVAQRVKVEEPDHLLCPITREMFRDPVMLVESGHTYERAAIEEHLRIKLTDPSTNVPIQSKTLCTNMAMRKTVDAWLEQNPVITPDGWDSRELLAPAHTQRGATPLHKCAREGQLNVARALIEAGADVNAKEDDGWTPLHHCAQKGHLEVVRVLIEKGADVNAKEDDGRTPLHLSASKGHPEVARALIEKGADVNAKNDDGETPLHTCALNGLLENKNGRNLDHVKQLEIARVLIKAGSTFDGLSSDRVTDLLKKII